MSAFTIRPASASDVPAIAKLIIQLYAAELPGALIGPAEGQEKLFRFTFDANGESAMRNRYVLCGEQGAVIGTGMIQFSEEPSFERAPDGIISKSFEYLGAFPTLKLLLTVARSLVGVHQHKDPQSALIHSVVVDQSQRGKGAGAVLLRHLEESIRARGLKRASLQVLESNAEAIPFYKKMGYKQIWQTPWWVSLLSWSSLVMEKEL